MQHPAGSLNERIAETQFAELKSHQERNLPAGTDKNWHSKDLHLWFTALLSQVNGRTGLTGAFLITEHRLCCIGHVCSDRNKSKMTQGSVLLPSSSNSKN